MQDRAVEDLGPTIGKPWLPRALDALGLSRPELRAWAMYDWANSAMVCTIITAVFPIYYSKVACAGLEPKVASRQLAIATTIGMVIIAVLSPILGAFADYTARKKKLLGSVSCSGCSLGRRDVFHPHRRLGPGLGPLHPGEHRGQRQLRLLRCPAAAHRPRRRDRPGLDARATRWATWEAGSCSPSTSRGS